MQVSNVFHLKSCEGFFCYRRQLQPLSTGRARPTDGRNTLSEMLNTNVKGNILSSTSRTGTLHGKHCVYFIFDYRR